MRWLFLLLLLTSMINADLEKYIFAKDKAFSWEELDKKDNVHKLAFTSQVWQEKSWYHHLYVVLPEGEVKNNTALLWIAGSGDGKTEIKFAKKIATLSKSVVFVLMAVPNQPMFNGLFEDQLLAYSIAKTIKKQDTKHLILYPMVKSAIQAMNLAQEFAKNKQLKIDSFVVTGASKRGWTTWLTSLDPRVKAIVPIVFDFLNIKKQIKHYMDIWGEYGSFVKDYDKAGVFRDIVTEKGTIVAKAIDPYSYRERILIPKFIVLATNDRFSPLINLNSYYEGLKGKTYICYVPNNRHRIKSTSRIRNIIVAALHYANSGEKLPEFSWGFQDKKQKVKIPLKIKGALDKVNIWHTDATTGRDFRNASWKSFELPKFITSATVRVREGIYRAAFVEAIFKYGNGEVSFSSTVRVFK
ncbi:PhoPQ-activated protein PqaA family protein [Candidatus Uabimicrobium amorphum]|uniref:PhoPQ-activated pathogenicity protein n=1 Tax=Uabimicrobium amorphum TaxID=2596890 RepID=A0A5S9F3F5_UABAM|nr:PhoPQ-activated protein PqaA family protein [Candidatus Uabimicrobium amorphum]BBM84123.1 PhoPQ-activated pathogenicity protein [Candidatus Uabimicrobium amorphum]